VTAAEMITSDSRLGRLVWEGHVSGMPPVVIVGMISIGLAGYYQPCSSMSSSIG